MQPNLSSLLQTLTTEPVTDGCSQMSSSMLPNVIPTSTANLGLATGVGPSDNFLRTGSPSFVTPRYSGKDEVLQCKVPNTEEGVDLRASQHQRRVVGAAVVLDADGPASCSTAPQGPSSTLSPGDVAVRGPLSASRPVVPQRAEGGAPARASVLTRAATLPVRPGEHFHSPQQQHQQHQQQQEGQQRQQQASPLMSGTRQQEQHQQHQQHQQLLQREILVLPFQEAPGGLPPDGGYRQQPQLPFREGHPTSAGQRQQPQQQQPQQQQPQQQQPQQNQQNQQQHRHYLLSPDPPQASVGTARGSSTTSGDTRAGRGAGGGVSHGADEVLAWELPLGMYDSMAGSPVVRPAGRAAAGAAAAATVEGAGGATAAAGGSPDPADRTVKPRGNASQVLLPPLLMRAGGGGADGAEPQTVFFGPGALPGLLNGSSPPEGGAGGTRLLGGPMFLHLTPTVHSRKQVSGMVPTAVPCLPNDDDSESLWGGASTSGGADVTPSVNCGGANALPSSAALLASYNRSLGLVGNASSVAAAAASAAAAAAAAPGVDADAPSAAAQASADGDAKLKPHGESWLLWTSALVKGSGLEEAAAAGTPASGGKVSFAALSPYLSAPAESSSRGVPVGSISSGAASGGAAAAPVTAAAAVAGSQHCKTGQLDGPDSSVSVAQLRPFHTNAQLGLDLDTTEALQGEAQGTSGGAAAGSDGDGGGGSRRWAPGAEAESDVAVEPGGWLMSDGGSAVVGSTSRRIRRGTGSTRADRAVAGGQGSFVSRERGSSNNGPLAVELPGEAGAVGREGQTTPRALAHGGGGSGGSGGGAAAASSPTSGTASSAVAAAAAAAPITQLSPPSRTGSVQHHHHHHHHHHCKRSAVRPLSAIDLCSGAGAPRAVFGSGSGIAGGGGGGGSVAFNGTGDTVYGSPPEAGAVAPESPKARWQRTARAAGLAASVARGFRTLRNQHDENLVREEQLKVLSEIGAGSFARVDKCTYTPTDGGTPFMVAVKRIKPEMLVTSRDPEDLQLFIQEAQLLRKLNHPHIVKYIGLGIVAEDPSGSSEKAQMDAEKLLELSRKSWGPPVRRLKSHTSKGPRRLDHKRSAARSPRGGAAAKSAYCSSDDEEEGAAQQRQSPPGPPPPLLRGVFIVEEFLAGGTLKSAVYRQMLRPQKQLYSNATALRWMAQVAAALSYMHTCRPKVLHRDIKLDNVLLQPSKAAKDSTGTTAPYEGCTAKLGDLGLAALLAHHRRHSGIGASDLEVEEAEPVRPPNALHVRSQASVAVRKCVTAAAQSPPHLRQANDASRLSKMLESHKRDRLGTYMYMAPEVYQRQKYDEKCDCFSFAMLLYEVFHRFITACSLEHSSQMEKYARQVAQGFRPAIHEDLPGPLRRIIKQCWAQDPADRPDMAAVAQELRTLEDRGGVAALDRKQQQTSGLMGSCCCVVS